MNSRKPKPPQLIEKKEIRVRVNDREYTGNVDVRMTLVDFIREDLALTGTHV